MKKLLFILLLSPSISWAVNVPEFSHKDPIVQREFENVGNEIKKARGSSFTDSDLTGGSTNYIQNTNTLQRGATAYPEFINTTSINGSGVWGFRNRIINGDMRIDQKNVGTAYTINGTGTFRHLDGNWQSSGASADGVFTVQQLTASPPTGHTHYVRNTVTTADASIGATQRYYTAHVFEGSNLKDFLLGTANAKTLTLSFWVRSSVTGSFSGNFANGAFNRSYPFSYTISSANTWEKETITLTGDTSGTWVTTTAAGMFLLFDLGSGTSNRGTAGAWTAAGLIGVTGAVSLISTLNATWDITGVQLEIGSQATEFEHRPDAVELRLCQRYFWKSMSATVAAVDNPNTGRGALTYFGNTAGVSNQGVWVQFPVEMRADPTITFFNAGATGSNWRNATDGANSGASSTQNIGGRGFIAINAQVAGDGAGERIEIHATASAEL